VLRRMWYAKNLVLWALVTPLCTLVAIGIGIYENRLVTTALSVVWIAAVPLGALGFSSWVGVWFPYHVLPLRYRWARRRRGDHLGGSRVLASARGASQGPQLHRFLPLSIVFFPAALIVA
jgi:hypothetical protein